MVAGARLLAAAVGAWLACGAPSPVAAAPGQPGVFGSTEVRSKNLSMFPKWTGALDRYFAERKLADAPCAERAFNKCHLQQWKAFLEGIRHFPPLEAMREVNRFANHARYIIDPVNYGMPDYWATPLQFMRKDGDCEDYAIIKFMSLRALGFDGDRLRLVVLQDMNLRAAHAVLVAFVDGTAWLLDNQVKDMVRADAIRHYRAIYSVNETSWWLHRY